MAAKTAWCVTCGMFSLCCCSFLMVKVGIYCHVSQQSLWHDLGNRVENSEDALVWDKLIDNQMGQAKSVMKRFMSSANVL